MSNQKKKEGKSESEKMRAELARNDADSYKEMHSFEVGSKKNPMYSFVRSFQDVIYCPCDSCKKRNAAMQCSQCKHVFYCNKECQKQHWKTHKANCLHWMQGNEIKLAAHLKAERYPDNYEKNRSEPCLLCNKIPEFQDMIQLACEHTFCINCITVELSPVRVCVMHETFKCPKCNLVFQEPAHHFPANGTESNIALAQYYLHYDTEKFRYYANAAREEYFRYKKVLHVCYGDDSHIRSEGFGADLDIKNLKIWLLEEKFEDACQLAMRLEKEDEIVANKTLVLHVQYCKSVAVKHLGFVAYALRIVRRAAWLIPQLVREDSSILPLSRQIMNEESFCCFALNFNEFILDVIFPSIMTDRHLDLLYELLSKYHKERKNDFDTAVICLQTAVKYELPWWPEHRTRMQAKLDALLQEKKEKEELTAKAK